MYITSQLLNKNKNPARNGSRKDTCVEPNMNKEYLPGTFCKTQLNT